MSEFKVGDKIVYHSLPHQRLFYVKASLSDSIVVRECLDEAGAKCFSEFPPYTDIRHATPQEITAGHRIDCETLDKPENHISPLCKSKDVEKDKTQTFDEVFKEAYDYWIDDTNIHRYEGAKGLAEQVWQHQQAKVEELQKRVDVALAVIMEYYTGSYDESPDLVVDIEQALKGEGQ
ncbi:hypothetical protein [Acinetobacter baumannii]|uniref:hypothetical protein n=1 Tax=Acinetobacter baumannii TaxID=470 RepID=UPI001020FCEB|nr:hypothetical protein [Acinetobacter baumannii]RYL19988.1 hypothetical protein EWO92_03060 [Acinetobacter baumannii]RYL32310.1 hypothetical protein EWO96_00755 [Acinetobacter baumannii]RYL45430.1 hypothetical protein EWP49_00755 [Acinetobacter baumannii]